MTANLSVERIVGAALQQLRIDLDGHHQVVDLSEWGEQRISSAIEWLLSVRSDEGYWGYRSPAVTAICSTAIALWRPVEADTLLRPSAEWLLEQAHDGTWETMWDTGAAITAAFVSGRSGDPRAQAAMLRLADEDPAVCARKPHHTAQVIAAGNVAEWPPAKTQRWCTQMEGDLRVDAGPYVVGQAVYGLLSAGWPVADVRDLLDHLASYLQRTPMSTAAFLDHAAALRALARAGSHPDVVDHTIDEFFGSAYRRDGSWYHEPWYTAWALLALHEANAVRRVVVEQPRLDEYLSRADGTLSAVRTQELRRAADERRARLTVMGATTLLLVGLAGVGFVVLGLPASNRFFTSGLAITLVTALIAVAWRLLWPLLRLPH